MEKLKSVWHIFFLVICLSAVLTVPSLIRGSTDPARNVKDWVVKEINEPTKVWQVAQKAAGGKFNIQDVVSIIRDKNPWLEKRNFALRTGDEVLVPVF